MTQQKTEGTSPGVTQGGPLEDAARGWLRVGTLADSSLIARPLGQYRMVNCASPAYLAEHGTPWTPVDLAAHRSGPHRRHLPRRVQVFMNWLAEVMAPRLAAVVSGWSRGGIARVASACMQ